MTAEEGAAAPPGSGATGTLVQVLVAAVLGVVVVALVTGSRSAPVESRLGQRVELVELIEAEQARNAALAARVEELSARLAEVERSQPGAGDALTALSAEVDALAAPTGMAAVGGPGVAVTLRDSRLAPPPDGDYNDYVIHEQDLQAVINALWGGGAEAMAVNGNRILSTTAIRCVGNVLLLHGRTYSPPYVVEAIGDEAELRSALERDPAVTRFAEATSRFQLGYTVEVADALELPGHEGGSAMQVARPVDAGAP